MSAARSELVIFSYTGMYPLHLSVSPGRRDVPLSRRRRSVKVKLFIYILTSSEGLMDAVGVGDFLRRWLTVRGLSGHVESGHSGRRQRR